MDVTDLPSPISRTDMYMSFLDGVTTIIFEDLPQVNEYSSRMDKYLYFLCQLKNSGGGGTGSSITVENVLTSTSTVNALSAMQGKTLNDKFLNYILTSKMGAVNGVATLDASGKVPLTQISVVNAKIVAVANQTARLALPVSTNLTIAIQSDTNWVWGLNANADPTLTTSWVDMGSADAKVASVNGSTGVVTITADGINAVPNTRKVNNKVLDADITITLGDLLTFNNDSSYYLSGKGILEPLPSSAGTVVENVLTSTSTTNALSALQGKVLNDKIEKAWTNYTPTITATTTNPTMATTKKLEAIYNVVGKTLYIKFHYAHISPSGASQGSGYYKFSIPTGYKIDIAKAIPIDLTYSGYGMGIGEGICRQDNYISPCEVVALNEDYLVLRTTLDWNLPIVSSSHYGLNISNALCSFKAEIPIL